MYKLLTSGLIPAVGTILDTVSANQTSHLLSEMLTSSPYQELTSATSISVTSSN